EQAVHQHGLGPRDRLLVAGHEASAGGQQELPRGVRRDEIAGPEVVADAPARPAVLDEVLEMDHLLSEADQLPPLTMRRDVGDLEGAPAPHLLEDEPEIVVAVEAAIDQMDAASLPGQGLPDGFQIGKDGRLLLEESSLLVPHGLEYRETGHPW